MLKWCCCAFQHFQPFHSNRILKYVLNCIKPVAMCAWFLENGKYWSSKTENGLKACCAAIIFSFSYIYIYITIVVWNGAMTVTNLYSISNCPFLTIVARYSVFFVCLLCVLFSRRRVRVFFFFLFFFFSSSFPFCYFAFVYVYIVETYFHSS